MEGAWKYSPAAAVPVKTKIPDPMIAPMPSAVSDQGPSVFLSRCSGASASASSLSMLLTLKSCEFTPTAGPPGKRVAKLYPEPQYGATVIRNVRGFLRWGSLLCPGEIGVAFNEFFRAVAGETYGELAILVFAVHMDNRDDSVGWMTHPLADERIAAALGPRRSGNFRSHPWRAFSQRCGRDSAHATRELFGGVGIFRVRFVAARFTCGGQ